MTSNSRPADQFDKFKLYDQITSKSVHSDMRNQKERAVCLQIPLQPIKLSLQDTEGRAII